MDHISEGMNHVILGLQDTLQNSQKLQMDIAQLQLNTDQCMSPWVVGLTVFALACVVGYYVVWRVTPALHSPLMAVTNAISSVIIVGAMLAAGISNHTLFETAQGSSHVSVANVLGLIGVFLASVNIFGGFMVTRRMLAMFSKSNKR